MWVASEAKEEKQSPRQRVQKEAAARRTGGNPGVSMSWRPRDGGGASSPVEYVQMQERPEQQAALGGKAHGHRDGNGSGG